MLKLRRLEAVLLTAERWLLVSVLAAMVALSFGQVIARQFFGTGLLWGDTLLRHLVLVVGFLGASLASAEGKHFAFELSVAKEGESRGWRAVAAELAGAAITAALVKAAWTFYVEERASGAALFTAGELTVPAWAFAIVIPAGFFLVLLHAVLRAAREAAALAGRR